MSGKTIEAVLRWLPVLISGLFALLLLLSVMAGEKRKGRRLFHSCKDLVAQIAVDGASSKWYQYNDAKLYRYGADFHFGKRITPYGYYMMRICLGLLGTVAFIRFGTIYGCMLGAMLFFLPQLLLLYLNKKDNEEMLSEIKLVYHSLEIQIRAGVYVAEALAECYNCVTQRRLRQALLDLATDMVVHGDIYEALTKFQTKFDNRHIDSLCIIILQALESGQAVELLQDLSEQIKDMEIALLAGKREGLSRKITFYQLGILAIVLGLVLYACVTQMLSAALSF